MHMRLKSRLWFFVLVLLMLLVVSPAAAQEPIALDELKSGAINDSRPRASYRFTATEGQLIEIDVLALSEGIVPTFTILREDAALGVWYALSPEMSITDQVMFTEAGEYTIQIGSTTPAVGQFVVTLTEVIPPPILQPNLITSGLLMAGDTQAYLINADVESTLDLRARGLDSSLSDDNGNVIGSTTAKLGGGFFTLTPGQYTLEIVNNSDSTAMTFEVVLESATTAPTAATDSPTATLQPNETAEVSETADTSDVELDANGRPILPETGDCILATLNNTRVNARTGPSTNNRVDVTISQFEVYPVTGRNGNRTWHQIDYGEGEAWVAISVTRLGGDCDDVPFVDAPIAPPPAPSATPVPPTSVPAPQPQPTSRSLDPSLGPGDADGDGIANTQDFCPFVSGVGTQFGGVSGADGCPVDSDSDGINDGLDQCPFAGGPANQNGCP